MYSRTTYTASGNTAQFSVPFDYLSKSHIKVFVDDTESAFKWPTRSQVKLAAVPRQGAKVRIERNTPIDEQPLDFQAGAMITENDLDTLAKYSLFVAQEAADKQALFNSTINVQVDTLDGGTY